jgi:hypothetical protein
MASATGACGSATVAGGDAAPLVTKLINSLAVAMTASGLHPVSMAIRRQVIRCS